MNRILRHRAQLCDQMQFFFVEYNDHQLHGVIFFDGGLDEVLLKKAVSLSMDAFPILKCRYVEGRRHPYWEETDIKIGDIVTFVDSADVEGDAMSFAVNKTWEFAGPQILVRFLRQAGQESGALCVIMNHMACDGAGFKEYLYMLGSIYSGHEVHGNGRRPDRSLGQIFRRISLMDRMKLLLLPDNLSKHDSGLNFPLNGGSDPMPFIARHKLDSVRFKALKEYGRKSGATINDIILAAYIRALYRVLDNPENRPLCIPCMIDLRRYLRDGKAGGICNLTATIVCDAGEGTGGDFSDTLAKVKMDMDRQKSGLPGLNGLYKLQMIFRLFAYPAVKKIIREKFVNPLIAMTNIGIIDKNRLSFGGIKVTDAFVTGSIKHAPYFQLALSSFNDSVTFTINQFGSAQDREKIEAFLRMLDGELPC
ncbi:MAG: hypothetical protein ABSG94_03035 [Brevinematales bacterium]